MYSETNKSHRTEGKDMTRLDFARLEEAHYDYLFDEYNREYELVHNQYYDWLSEIGGDEEAVGA